MLFEAHTLTCTELPTPELSFEKKNGMKLFLLLLGWAKKFMAWCHRGALLIIMINTRNNLGLDLADGCRGRSCLSQQSQNWRLSPLTWAVDLALQC